MTEKELRGKMTIAMGQCYSQELSACPNHPIFQPQKAINLIFPLIKEAGYVRAEDIETGYRKAGMQKVVDWVENQRMAAKTLIEGVGYGIVIPDEAWADFKKSEGLE